MEPQPVHTKRSWLRLLLRRFREQGGLCMYCDRPCWHPKLERPADAAKRLRVTTSSPAAVRAALAKRKASREHIQRRADGGQHHAANIGMACASCNAERHATSPDQHRQAMLMKYTRERLLIARADAQEATAGTRSAD